MKALSRQEVVGWCQANQIALNALALPDRRDLDFKFKIPEDAQKRVVLAKQTMRAFAEEATVLLWFDDWSVWQAGQRMQVFDRMRMSYGENRSIAEAPAQLFQQNEMEDAISFAIISVLFLWDCYVLCPDKSKLLIFSHDEYGYAKGVPSGKWLELV